MCLFIFNLFKSHKVYHTTHRKGCREEVTGISTERLLLQRGWHSEWEEVWWPETCCKGLSAPQPVWPPWLQTSQQKDARMLQ